MSLTALRSFMRARLTIHAKSKARMNVLKRLRKAKVVIWKPDRCKILFTYGESSLPRLVRNKIQPLIFLLHDDI